VYKVQDQTGYDPSDLSGAMTRAREFNERIPIGILYRSESQPAYEEQEPSLEAGTLVDQPLRLRTLEDYDALKREYV